MMVQVLLFAAHRELAGKSRMAVDVPEGTTLQDLYDLLSRDIPRIEELRSSTSFAVNREVVPAATALRAGDEVALLQPVSGGAE